MAKLLIQVQEPTVEIPVSSKDGSGVSKKILVGFKRYQTEESAEKTKDYEAIVEQPDFSILDCEELNDFIKSEILYIKNIALDILDEDTGAKKVLKIKDTRAVKKIEGLWDTPEECLDVLLDGYFAWSSWRLSFISAVQTAIVDMDFEAGAVKN